MVGKGVVVRRRWDGCIGRKRVEVGREFGVGSRGRGSEDGAQEDHSDRHAIGRLACWKYEVSETTINYKAVEFCSFVFLNISNLPCHIFIDVTIHESIH